MGGGRVLSGLHLPAGLLAAIAITYGAVTVYFTARFVWRWQKIRVLRRDMTEVVLAGKAALVWKQCSERFGIHDARVAISPQIFGPVTIGISHKLVLLPVSMASRLEETEMWAAVAHEFAHMQRNDFLKNLIYELLSLPVTFHPLFSFTRARVIETREIVCDQMAAEVGEPQQYARSLLRLASRLVKGVPTRTPHAIGIFDANTFERRVMRLTEKETRISAMRRLAIVSACGLLGLGTCSSALALSMHVDALAADSGANVSAPSERVSVSAEKMAGHILKKVAPEYPEEPKRAGIQGTVKLDAVISKSGAVENLKVVSGPKELQKSALDAVRQWTYKPYLVDGVAVEVATTINIIYSRQE
jgi:TonB family protein